MSALMETSIKLLSERNCSQHELRGQLEKAFLDLPDLYVAIDNTMARLAELHLLNDGRIAESLVSRYSHKGNRFITQTLRQKWVDDEVIAEALGKLGDEYARAMDEARKKGARNRDEAPEKAKNRLYRFLSGRGFSHETIKTVVNELMNDGFFAPMNEEASRGNY